MGGAKQLNDSAGFTKFPLLIACVPGMSVSYDPLNHSDQHNHGNTRSSYQKTEIRHLPQTREHFKHLFFPVIRIDQRATCQWDCLLASRFQSVENSGKL